MKKVLTITLLVLLTVGLFIACDSGSVEKVFKKENPIVSRYTVKFIMQSHGTQIDPITGVISGSKISAPTDPTADGFLFDGWYKEEACTNKWNFDSDTVIANTTLYAKWLQTKTVSEILQTNSKFPGSDSNAWVINDEAKCYKDGENLHFVAGGTTCDLPLTTVASGNGVSFACSYNDAIFTFKIIEGELSSIVVENSSGLEGTYVPAGTTFKAVYNTTNDENILTFYYDNVDYSGDNITVYQDGSDNYLFDKSRNYYLKWGYNSNTPSIKSVVIDPRVENYNGLTSTAYMFCNMTKAESIRGTEYLDVSNVTDMTGMFHTYGKNSTALTEVPNVSEWDTSNVTGMSQMFYNYGYSSTSLNEVPNVSEWDTSNVTDMSQMFYSYGHKSSSLNSVPNVRGWTTDRVTNMSKMFMDYGHDSNSLNNVPDVSGWKTFSVKDMSSMFYCYGNSSTSLTKVPNVSNWETDKVTDISSMFEEYGKNSTELTSVPNVTKWTTSNVTSMGSLFNKYGYSSKVLVFELDLSGWNVKQVTSYQSMFFSAGKSAKTWSVTIPAKTTDEKENEKYKWYLGDGINYISPEEGEFTLAPTNIT